MIEVPAYWLAATFFLGAFMPLLLRYEKRVTSGIRGYTPPNAGKIIPPKGGSGVVPSEAFGRAVAKTHGWDK